MKRGRNWACFSVRSENMDEAQLKKIMQNVKAPEPDDNARKRALNLAVSEFKAHQKNKQESSQGFSFLRRLTGNSEDSKQRRNPMERKSNQRLIYGGMATAMAVVLIAGVSLTQLQD